MLLAVRATFFHAPVYVTRMIVDECCLYLKRGRCRTECHLNQERSAARKLQRECRKLELREEGQEGTCRNLQQCFYPIMIHMAVSVASSLCSSLPLYCVYSPLLL